MAEYVKQRMMAARVGVTMAFFGLLAGLGLNRGEPAAVELEPLAAKPALVPLNSIGSRQVRNHSLLHKDFKLKQVYSQRQANRTFAKSQKVSEALVKLQKVSEALLKIPDLYLQRTDTAADALKLGGVDAAGFVHGKGNVQTAQATVPEGGTESLLSVPLLVEVIAGAPAAERPTIRLVNAAPGGSVHITHDGGTPITVPQGGASAALPLGEGPHVFQAFWTSGQGPIATITISALGGPDTRVVGQALVGSL